MPKRTGDRYRDDDEPDEDTGLLQLQGYGTLAQRARRS